MSDDRSDDKTAASAEHLKASVTEAIGKLTGDARTEAEGKRRKRDAETAGVPDTTTPKPGGPGRH